MKIFTPILLVLCLMACASKNLSRQKLEVTVFSYGLWKPLDLIDKEQKSNVLEVFEGLALIERTKEIPMEIGNIFIFRWRVVGPDGTYKTKMIQVQPESKAGALTEKRIIQDSDFTIVNGQFEGFWGHELFEQSQLVPGPWRYEIYYAGELLLAHEFMIK